MSLHNKHVNKFGKEIVMKSVKKRSFKLITTLIAAIVLTMAMAITVFATEENDTSDGSTTQMKVTTENVNVRSDADSNSTQLTQVNTGQIVDVLGTKNDASGNTWYNVTFTNSSTGVTYTGYIYGQYLTTYEAPADTPADDGAGTETEEQQPADQQSDITPGGNGTFTPMEGDGQPSAVPETFRSVYVKINGTEIPAWTNDAYYIFYAMLESGETSWIIYEANSGAYIKYDPSFMAGSVASGDSVSENGKGGSNAAVVILVIVCILLVIASLFMGMKLLNQSGGMNSPRPRRRFDDDDDDDDDEDDDDEDDDDEEDERLRRKGGLFQKFSKSFDDDDDDEDDDDEDDDDEDDEDDEPVRRPAQRTVRQQAAPAAPAGPQGTRIVRDAQGRRIVVNAQGQKVVTNPQGQSVVTNAQGQRVVTNAQGQRVVINANGQRVVQARRRPGSAVQTQRPVETKVDEDDFDE